MKIKRDKKVIENVNESIKEDLARINLLLRKKWARRI